MSAAATQRAAMLAEFEAAGPDGVPEPRLIEIGGLYWRERLKELCAQGHPIGWGMVEGEKTYFLSEPVVERTTGTTVSTFAVEEIEGSLVSGSLSDRTVGVERAGGMGGDAPPSLVAGSLSPEPETLFPTSQSHFREAA